MTFDQSSITNTNTAAYAGSSGTYTGTSSGTYTGTSTTTGSWADSTHSVIWMTRGNVLRGMGLSRQPWGKRIASLVLIAAMMLLAQANLIDVYGGVATWAIAAVPATLLGAIIALAGMLPALRLWWQIVFLAFAQFIIGPVVTLSSTTSHYVIPTLKTLSSGWEMTFGSFKYIISVDPPLGTQDGVLMAYGPSACGLRSSPACLPLMPTHGCLWWECCPLRRPWPYVPCWAQTAAGNAPSAVLPLPCC